MKNIADIITNDVVEKFQEDGVVVLRQIIEDKWIETLKHGLHASIERKGKYVWNFHGDTTTGNHFHNENRRWPDINEYKDFLFNSPVAEACGRLGRWQTANLLYDSVFLRTPGTAVKTPWHHDQPYVCIDGPNALISAWTPLYPVQKESGLECIRGSHKWNKNYFRLNFNSSGPRGHMSDQGDSEMEWDELPDIEANRDDYDIISYDLEPGDTLVIHGRVIHGSQGNQRKDLPVAVCTARFLSENALYVPDKPGGTQPNLREEAAQCGVNPGDHVDSTLFPRAWSAQ